MARAFTYVALILFIALEVVIYAMPLAVALPFVVFCLWLLFYRKLRAELALLLFSLLLLFAVFEIAARLFADDIFYREHEKWALKGRYRANVHDNVQARFGDLVAMEPTLKDTIAEPHPVEFITDSNGFRNTQDYNNEPYIILGDSFATTIGNTQADILVSQLNAKMPGSFYSLAYPGAPKDYEAHALTFLEGGQRDARFVWFIFEGNDFSVPGAYGDAPRRPSQQQRLEDKLNPRELPFMATRALGLFFKAAKAHLNAPDAGDPPTSKVAVFFVDEKPVGFLKEYINRQTASKMELRLLATPEVMERTACVFFIPDKYRVYKPWIKNGPSISEPVESFKALHEVFGERKIPVVDLTPTLQAAAKSALEKHQFIFWRDDTHWNKDGISSIVGEVENCVKRELPSLRAAREAIQHAASAAQ